MRTPDYDEPRCAIGRVLKAILAEKRWRKADLARLFRVEPAQITKYWKGERTPEWDRIDG